MARLGIVKGLADKLVFKGGFVLLKVLESQRFTKDLDALASGIAKDKIGDVILRQPKLQKIRPLLPLDQAVSWRIYPTESILAKNLETLINRGSANSRAKDIYNIILLLESIQETLELRQAILTTFTNRLTAIPNSFVEFFKSLDLMVMQNSWGAVDLQQKPMSFNECCEQLLVVFSKIDLLVKTLETN